MPERELFEADLRSIVESIHSLSVENSLLISLCAEWYGSRSGFVLPRGFGKTETLLAYSFIESVRRSRYIAYLCNSVYQADFLARQFHSQACWLSGRGGQASRFDSIDMNAHIHGQKVEVCPFGTESCMVEFKGIRSGFKGMTYRSHDGVVRRPDLILLDDPFSWEDHQSIAHAERRVSDIKRLSGSCDRVLLLATDELDGEPLLSRRIDFIKDCRSIFAPSPQSEGQNAETE